MELSRRGRRNTVVFLLVLTLITVGLALTFSTWQILRQQSESSLQYMSLSARAISKIIEGSYHRSMRMGQESVLLSQLGGFFNYIDANSDVAFLEISRYDSQQGEDVKFFASRSKLDHFPLPQKALLELSKTGVWYGILENKQQKAFVYASLLFEPVMMQRGPHHMMGSEPRLEQSPFPMLPGSHFSDSILKVGLNLDSVTLFHERFRSTALLQVGYTLAAAIFVWLLAAGLISRRELAGKARYLQRFQAQLLDNVPDGLLTISSNGMIQATNRAVHDILGVAPGSLAGTRLDELPRPLMEMLDESGADFEGDLSWKHLELDGKHLEVLASSFSGARDEVIRLVLLRNRTKIFNLEKSLADAEKRAAVGVLAAGVAHEIRNPLASLRGFAQYFAKKLSGIHPDEEYATTMVNEADRLNRVITDLLYLSRPKLIHPGPLDLQDLCSEISMLMRFDLESKSTVLQFDLQLRKVWADEDSLKQSLLNLILNSLDSIGEKYEILVDEEDRKPSDNCNVGFANESFIGKITVSSQLEGNYVVIRVSDNGKGMSDEESKRACDAFYTSKSKGTGLGLALVSKAVQEHSGKLEITAVPNEACTVSIFLPDLVSKESAPEEENE